MKGNPITLHEFDTSDVENWRIVVGYEVELNSRAATNTRARYREMSDAPGPGDEGE